MQAIDKYNDNVCIIILLEAIFCFLMKPPLHPIFTLPPTLRCRVRMLSHTHTMVCEEGSQHWMESIMEQNLKFPFWWLKRTSRNTPNECCLSPLDIIGWHWPIKLSSEPSCDQKKRPIVFKSFEASKSYKRSVVLPCQ